MHQKRLYGTATVGTKGQIVIPADAREELGIKPGDRLYVLGSPQAKAVVFIQEEQLEGLIEKLNINIEAFQKHKETFNSKKDKD